MSDGAVLETHVSAVRDTEYQRRKFHDRRLWNAYMKRSKAASAAWDAYYDYSRETDRLFPRGPRS